MSDISGSFTVSNSTNLTQLQNTALQKVNDQLATEGKGAITDASLIQVTTVQNTDGTTTVSYSYTLDPPSDDSGQNRTNAYNALSNLSNDSDAYTDVYQIMEEFALISKKMRDVSSTAEQGLLKQQVSSLLDSAKDIMDGAGWALAGSIAMGTLEVAGGIAQLGAASSALGAVNEAKGLTNEAATLTEEESTLTPKENALSLNEDDSVSENDSPSRKNAIDLSDENEVGSNNPADDDEDVQGLQLEEEESLQEQDAKDKKTTNDKKAQDLKDRAAMLTKIADIYTQKGQGWSAAFTGAGNALKGGGDYANQMYSGASKEEDADATLKAGQRDSMVKFKDASQQALNAAIQSLGQLSENELQSVRKIFA